MIQKYSNRVNSYVSLLVFASFAARVAQGLVSSETPISSTTADWRVFSPQVLLQRGLVPRQIGDGSGGEHNGG